MSFISRIRALWTFGRGVALGLPDPEGDEDPVELYRGWFREAVDAGIFLPESAALATATPDGRPSVRMVLVKEASAEGFTFFTNYESRKARELEANPHAALVLHWAILERQVRIEGRVERLPEERSAAYFRTRTRGSRIGAWASRQSARLEDRRRLEERVEELEKRFAGQEVPLPPFWGGYRLIPRRIEFWQGRADRLHDRWVWERDGEGWAPHRLYP